MSDINKMVGQILSEELGYAGAEMYNEPYPAMQMDSGDQQNIKVKSEGDPVVTPYGTDTSKFHIDLNYPGSRMGDPNVEFVKGKDPVFSKALNLVNNLKREGDPVVSPKA